MPAQRAASVAEGKPEPLRIEVIDRAELQIEWADGATTSLTGAELRAACPCAGCGTVPGADRSPAAFPDATIEAADLVGSYGVSFVFGPNGHSTGIYSFGDLRRYSSD